MGSVFQSVFGGQKQKAQSEQKSWNEAYPYLQDTFSGVAGQTGQASNAIAALLGMNGDATEQEAAFDRFRDSTGYQFLFDEGMRGVTSQKAANGLLRSGSYGTALQNRGQQLAATSYGDYLDRLMAQANLGLGAGGLIAGAGQRSEGSSSSSGSSKKGLGGFLGKIGSSIAASDPRLKENVIKLATLSDGLGVYSYDYIDGPKDQVGVMADEVSALRPWALGPERDGYMTVDYSKLGRR